MDHSEARNAAFALKEKLNLIAELDETKLEIPGPIDTPNGRATGTYGAAMCAIDYMRTSRFMQGVVDAISDVLHKKGRADILYAGSGPFALLVLPLTFLFDSSQVQIQCIELNPASGECLKKLINKLNIKSFFRELIQDDAAIHQLHHPETYDVLLTETMQQALIKETQVPITINLLNQCRKDVILLPREIKVNFSSLQPNFSEGKRIIKKTIPLLQLNKRFATEHADWLLQRPKVLFEKTLELEEDFCTTEDIKVYHTYIDIYNNSSLTINESGLTMPLRLKTMEPLEKGQTLKFQYTTGVETGFKYEVI